MKHAEAGFHVKQWVWALAGAALLAGCAGISERSIETPTASRPPPGATSALPVEVMVSGSDVGLTGFLYRPAKPGVHPAMLHLHGCAGFRNAAGVPNASYRFWAEHWVRLGFVVLILDSLTPRGEKEICTQNFKKIRANIERVRDAYAALSYLAGLADVNHSRIFLQGWSNGASTVLNALSADAPGRNTGGPQFRAGVAFYPGCSQLVREYWQPTLPLLIQAGAADDWTPVRFCERIVERAKFRGAPVELDVYPDAHHSFDRLRLPLRFRSGVGANRKGAHVGTNPEMREKSLRHTTAWVLSQVP